MTKQSQCLERAKETYRFHRHKVLANEKWTIAQTAKSLKRSLGSIAEDLLIARWCKTHEKQLEQFDHTFQVLNFIRQKQKEQDTAEID